MNKKVEAIAVAGLAAETGLALVPPGYFWRVTRFPMSYPFQMQLWRKVFGFFPVPVSGGYALFTLPDERGRASSSALERISDRLLSRELQRTHRAVLGKYPPNRASVMNIEE